MCSENKGVDKLRSNCTADLRLCFRILQIAGFLMQQLNFSTCLFPIDLSNNFRHCVLIPVILELIHEKIFLRSFRPGSTQTRLHRGRRSLEAGIFIFKKKGGCTTYVNRKQRC